MDAFTARLQESVVESKVESRGGLDVFGFLSKKFRRGGKKHGGGGNRKKNKGKKRKHREKRENRKQSLFNYTFLS